MIYISYNEQIINEKNDEVFGYQEAIYISYNEQIINNMQQLNLHQYLFIYISYNEQIINDKEFVKKDYVVLFTFHIMNRL